MRSSKNDTNRPIGHVWHDFLMHSGYMDAHHYTGNTPVIQFERTANMLVEKYCALTLPYKPGLYSITWESSTRVQGLQDELHEAANEVAGGKPLSQLQLVIDKALKKYVIAIEAADDNTLEPFS